MCQLCGPERFDAIQQFSGGVERNDDEPHDDTTTRPQDDTTKSFEKIKKSASMPMRHRHQLSTTQVRAVLSRSAPIRSTAKIPTLEPKLKKQKKKKKEKRK
jgi:hypothetical protein